MIVDDYNVDVVAYADDGWILYEMKWIISC